MLNAMTIKRIKTLQRSAGVDDESYRALLAGYGVESCKDLSPKQGAEVIGFLQGLAGGQVKGTARRAPTKRYDELGRRPGMASPKQLRMLEAMWMDVTRQSSRESALDAYCTWLLHRFRVGRPEWIEDVQVGKIKMALEQMLS